MCEYQQSLEEDLSDALDPVDGELDQNIDATLQGLDAVLEGLDAEAMDKNDEETDGKRNRNRKNKGEIVIEEHLSDGIREKTEATVYIKPIPATLESKHDLKAACEEIGEVVHVHICTNRRFAFVHFAEVVYANAATEIGKMSVCGEDVEVKKVHGLNTMAKKANRRRQRELAFSFKESRWDSLAALLDFFENSLSLDAVDFVNCMPQVKTDQLIDTVVACILRGHWSRLDRICDILNSLDHAQVESIEAPEALNVSEAVNVPGSSKKARRRRQHKVAAHFSENPADSVSSLLDFFENELTPEALDFVKSLAPEETSKLMAEVVTCTGNQNWLGIDSICASLNSLDYAQLESIKATEGLPVLDASNLPGTSNKARRRRQRKVALGFTEGHSDSALSLLDFFENELAPEAVDFVNSLAPEETSKLMAQVVTCTRKENWLGIDDICASLKSLDYAQVEAIDHVNLASPGMNHSKIRAILKYLQGLGGEGPIGLVGGKHGVKKRELENAGFVCTPVGTTGQHVVTAPAELLALLDGEMVESRHAPDYVTERKRRKQHVTQLDSNQGSSKRQRIAQRSGQGFADASWNTQPRSHGPGPSSPPHEQIVSPSWPSLRTGAPVRPSMAPHLVERMRQKSVQASAGASKQKFNVYAL